MSIQTHLIFKYYKNIMVVMAYKVLLNHLVQLKEMVSMAKMAVKEIRENLDHKDQQDQEMEVWSLLDGDEPPVL